MSSYPIRTAIRAWLFPFFRPSKASVEPVLRTDDPGSVMYHIGTEGLQALYGDGTVKLLNPYQDDPSKQFARSPAPQHPLAPEREPPALTWDIWSRMSRENARRGWSFARYAVKAPPPEDRMACVFGIVRGAWGICRMDFYICGAGTYDTLNAITHLPSGMGYGLFTDQESAAIACDIAARLADDWETLDPYADGTHTGRALDRMHRAWAAAGLTKCETHAHATADRDSVPVPIWFQDYNTVVAGRPEGKLS